jgi:hypothetical protein
MRSTRLLPSLSLLVAACTGGGGAADRRLPAYDATDPCTDYTDVETCAADAACEWLELGACPMEGGCPGGVCVAIDPCRAHADQASCEADADNRCAWAASELLCPPGADCGEGGFCYATTDDDECACVCPLYCPEGAECPPCECDCADDDIGDTCTCVCETCAEGEPCPPCACECDEGGDTCGDTCTCVCPMCPEGVDCPPCDCDCGDDGSGGGGDGDGTCVCPDCGPGESCPPCDCGGGVPPESMVPVPADDPCSVHADPETCEADVDNRCAWAYVELECPPDVVDCPTGACYQLPEDTDCVCVCPDCYDDPVPCLAPCWCDCGGIGDGCIEPEPGTP